MAEFEEIPGRLFQFYVRDEICFLMVTFCLTAYFESVSLLCIQIGSKELGGCKLRNSLRFRNFVLLGRELFFKSGSTS